MATPNHSPERDENQEVTELLAQVTGTPPPNAEDLLADPELQRQLREAKARAEKTSDSRGSGGGGSGGGGPPAPPPPPTEPKNEIPEDAPFIYLDAKKTKRVVLVTNANELDLQEWNRLKSWFKLQFFVNGSEPPDGSEKK